MGLVNAQTYAYAIRMPATGTYACRLTYSGTVCDCEVAVAGRKQQLCGRVVCIQMARLAKLLCSPMLLEERRANAERATDTPALAAGRLRVDVSRDKLSCC
jgi:hypothetical protein